MQIGRREIELMQALCIYNIYIEYYSVTLSLSERLYLSGVPVVLVISFSASTLSP